ncbi:MAG: mitochondrial fission ELM1 family protein [Candidatus Omnitrophica bacterium]|nr:mitochondrial fission ELM1 family protein [Candidatus Omnitrophota bacterium]
MMYSLAKLIRKALLKLPLGFSLFLAKAIGLFIYLNGRKRKVAFRNLKAAFPEKTSRQVHSILRKSFNNFGLTIIEQLIISRIYENVTIKEKEGEYPGGGIFVGIHAGNWELSMSCWAQRHKFAAYVQQQKHRGLDKFLNELRQEGKIKVCFTLRELIKCVREDYMIGVVLDHGAENDALEIEFFSHLVPTPRGAVYLARKFNKKIYVSFCQRKKNFSHILEIGKPIDVEGRDDKEVLTELNKIYQKLLEKYPWEYFWYYKRFKRKVNRDVVVLSDGKPGHLKQAKALLSLLSEESSKIRSKVIEVKYKNVFGRIFADIVAFFVGKHCLGCGFWLSKLVDEKTWQELDRTYADAVISAGSFIAPVNKLFSSYLGAKSVTVLRPNIPLRKFDLAIIPEHDRIQADSAVMIKGALFYPDNFQEKVKNCEKFFNLGGDKKISLFLGGPISEKEEFVENVKLFIPKIKEYSLKQGYKILISTSRRTPREVEDYLEKEAKDFEGLEALVVANKTNHDFVFEGFGGLADVVFVSSESISMVSEIASLQKPCVCVFFEPEDDKRKVFLRSMKEEISFLRKPYNISSVKLKTSLIFDRNKAVIKKALEKIL